MARPEGIEPPTHRLEICCSIQLSYGRVMDQRLNYFIEKSRLLHFFLCDQSWRRKLRWCWHRKIWVIDL